MTDQIQSRPPRDRPSIYDVAKLAGVSHQTVSRVINQHKNVRESTRARVLRAMKDVDYTPSAAARNLATNRSRQIGVIVDGRTYHGPNATLLGIEDAAKDEGYSVTSISGPFTEPSEVQAAFNQLREQNIDALCVIAPRYSANSVRDLDIPFVLVEAEPDHEVIAASVDQFAGALLAVDHLLELGHRRILHVAGPQDWADGRIRARAYSERMAEAGQTPYIVVGDWQSDFGFELGTRKDFPGDATAVFVSNDQMALGLLHGMHTRGIRVPDDVSIVGFDDIPEAKHFIPPLTTVRQDFHALGRAAVSAVINELKGNRPSAPASVMPELIVRESTAPVE